MAKKKEAAAPEAVVLELEYRVFRDEPDNKSRVEAHVTKSPAGGIALEARLAGKFKIELVVSGAVKHEWRIEKTAGTVVTFGDTQGAVH